ncbi:GNAT family N-acetyltransferase [Halostella sp. JP-L12]|uniref:GNAT family N-acetyltransferase n=1 Tax=Halostella TaxID=1843185 RepID=UPI000EF81F98|nr:MULTISPECIES: GNAT family protein [Halostella]NHN48458.1 GNAT family N-acetyltransferase [Halostella sp. JP-L12]
MPGARVASGERVTLRTAEQEDVPFLQRGCTDPEIRYPLGTPVRNQEEIEIWDDDAGSDRFIVCLDGDETGPGQPDEVVEFGESPDDHAEDAAVRRIGMVAVQDADYKRPELGYWLVPEVHGEGYGTEAVSLLVDYAFRTYDAPAVGAGAFGFNDASRGLLESLGFAEEGRRRKFMFVDGAHRDMVQYGLLREEWRDGNG